MIHYLLILYLSGYAFTTSITMQEFGTKAQCEAVREHVISMQGLYRDSECFPLPPQ